MGAHSMAQISRTLVRFEGCVAMRGVKLASLEAYPKGIEEDNALEKEPARQKHVAHLTSRTKGVKFANQEQAFLPLVKSRMQIQC